jgi:hypothetical protein
MNAKLRDVSDSHGCPIKFFATVGQVNDDIGAGVLLSNISDVDWLRWDL